MQPVVFGYIFMHKLIVLQTSWMTQGITLLTLVRQLLMSLNTFLKVIKEDVNPRLERKAAIVNSNPDYSFEHFII